MNPTRIRGTVIAERTAWIRKMLAGIHSLPLSSYDEFNADARNVAAAESYLRRALEALLDMGRHMLAKRFAVAATEYKEIGTLLVEHGVLTRENGDRLRRMGGYRNRLVHFYHEIDSKELYQICTTQVHDLETILESFLTWLRSHPEEVDNGI